MMPIHSSRPAAERKSHMLHSHTWLVIRIEMVAKLAAIPPIRMSHSIVEYHLKRVVAACAWSLQSSLDNFLNRLPLAKSTCIS